MSPLYVIGVGRSRPGYGQKVLMYQSYGNGPGVTNLRVDTPVCRPILKVAIRKIYRDRPSPLLDNVTVVI